MIRAVLPSQFDAVLNVINEAAQAYKGVIPEDRWKEPYMHREELKEEIQNGIQFYTWTENDTVVAVMGIQQVNDVTLIRHAYVAPHRQRKGIGAKLLMHLLSIAPTTTVLVGTWQAAYWAIRFYEKHGFQLVSNREKDMLLRKYWRIPERQIETSVVLKLKTEN
ncbi:GNAT family N-acetyltransferase [Candidatus Bathyarchaeota archaeon A05DMB-2]|jgi:GNAT superfamily N-acetyltransferase|nr:GNAT family N-acetyltransferase [Candidatus Bathyarchaeota archaeon A05DMB-2]